MPPNLDHDDKDSHLYPPKNLYNINNKIMVIAIISLVAVVVLVIALHIYARCVLRRQARRRATLRQIGLTMIHVPDPPKTGLDPLVIASLPIFVYKTNKETDHDDSTSNECAVCLSCLEDEEMARLLPNCNHFFHSQCIDKWLSSHFTCPICRTEAQPRLQPELREGTLSGRAPSAPPLERVNSITSCIMEGTSVDGGCTSAKVNGSSSRLSSFRRMLSRERSSRRIFQAGVQEDGVQDIERQ